TAPKTVAASVRPPTGSYASRTANTDGAATLAITASPPIHTARITSDTNRRTDILPIIGADARDLPRAVDCPLTYGYLAHATAQHRDADPHRLGTLDFGGRIGPSHDVSVRRGNHGRAVLRRDAVRSKGSAASRGG